MLGHGSRADLQTKRYGFVAESGGDKGQHIEFTQSEAKRWVDGLELQNDACASRALALRMKFDKQPTALAVGPDELQFIAF